MDRSRDTDWDYGPLERAFALAARTHQGTPRKGSDIPYLSHPMAVSSLVMVHGGDATEAAAGLLHDVAEDGGGAPRLDEIAEQCGAAVAAIVRACSDSLVDTGAGEEKAPWEQRKRSYIDHLRSPGVAPGAVLVSACDNLHNLTAIADDYEQVGEALWTRFKTGWSGQHWYYQELLECFRACSDPRVAGVAARIQAQMNRLEASVSDRERSEQG